MMKKTVILCLMLTVAVFSHGQYSKEASVLIDRAAGGDGDAEWELAMRHIKGEGVPRHYYLAMHWMAQAYHDGQEKRVKDFFRSIARCDRRNPHYAFMAYMKGNVYYLCCEEPSVAALWYSRADAAGDIPEARTMYCMSYCNFLKPVEGAQQEIRRLVALRKEASLKDPLMLTLEANALYEKGDTATAFRLWQTASDAGMPLADDRMGQAYLTAKGKYYDVVKAVRHFQRADRMKMLDAHKLYSLCHEHGLGGLKKDTDMAARIMRREEESMRMTYLLDVINEEDLLKTAPVKK